MTRPDGLHPGVPEVEYHGDPALSQSAAKLLLPPSTPAHFRQAQDGPRVEKTEFDLGHAAHKEVLGVGADVVVPCDKDGVPYDAWRSKDAIAQVAAIRAEGKTPVKAGVPEQVAAMAAVVRGHEQAGWLLDPDNGDAEQSAWWHDPESGLRLRARFDWVTTLRDGRLAVVDYKTTDRPCGASPGVFAKTVGNLRYYLQDTWYREAVEGTTGQPAADTPFLFVVQEITAPYAVTVVDLDDDYRAAGHDAMRLTIGTYLSCTESGEWPSYPSGITTLTRPAGCNPPISGDLP